MNAKEFNDSIKARFAAGGYADELTHIVGNIEYPDKQSIEATFQVTEGCTLACKYCYQHDKSPKRMSLDTAKKYIDCMFRDFKDTHYAVILDFIGGEPLLEPELISDIVDYWDYQCIMHYPEVPWGLYTRFSMCSNGTEWDKPEVQKLMKKIKNRVSFSVSIDGNKELHDSARVHPDGSGSYDEAIHAATEYQNASGIEIGSKMTISPQNLWYLFPALKHYMESGAIDINANTVYEEGWNVEHAQLFYKELKRVVDYKLENYPFVRISLFDERSFVPIGKSENTAWCGGNGKMLACDPDGVLYPCLRYMPTSVGRGKPEYVTCGHVDTGIDYAKELEMQKIGRREYSDDRCFNCRIAQGCGDCAAYRWEKFGTITKRTTFHCQMHQARALANVYYWNKLSIQMDAPLYFEMYIPDDWALEIIDQDELNMLKDLVEQAKEHAGPDGICLNTPWGSSEDFSND